MQKFVGRLIRSGYSGFEDWRAHTSSLKYARKVRRLIAEAKGRTVLGPSVENRIIAYCDETLGSRKFFDWLAVYTEFRGAFVEGWLPNDLYERKVICCWNPRKYSMISTCKTFDGRIFPGYSVPSIVSRVSGVYFDSSYSPISEVQAKGVIDRVKRECVLKRDGGSFGRGLKFFRSSREIEEALKSNSDFVIQPVVQQAQILGRLNESSLNTFRVYTKLSLGAARVCGAILRFGRKGARVDNVTAGGGFLPLIDGRIESSAFDGFGRNIGEAHPDTGLRFSELDLASVIPEIYEFCIDAHMRYPYVKFVGWDVGLDIDYKPVLIEWNARCPTLWRYEALLGPFFSVGEFLDP
ncbi:MAG: sugar-transfer associated ATP-grasp domain-containing protein [Wenzhouxiangella sp.]